MTEKERKLWGRISDELAGDGVPRAVASAITPFSAWWLIGSIIVFIPLALLLSFYVQRHAVLVQAGELVVVDLSFWRYRVAGERLRVPLAEAQVAAEETRLTIEGETFHLEPGWKDVGERIAAAPAAA